MFIRCISVVLATSLVMASCKTIPNTSGLASDSSAKAGTADALVSDPAAFYLTGKVTAYQDGVLTVEGNGGQKFQVSGRTLSLQPGDTVHIQANQPSDDAAGSDVIPLTAVKTYKLKPISQMQFPTAIKYSPAILSTQPFSRRTLQFAKVYGDMAKNLEAYLNEKRLPTSFHFEPHVMFDLSMYLTKLENVRDFLQKIAARSDSLDQLGHEAYVYMVRQNLLTPTLRLCGGGIQDTAKLAESAVLLVLKSKPLECATQMDRLYKGLTSLNLYLFRHNAGADLSPYVAYFKAAAGNPYFSGRVTFADDLNGILQEAFYQLFLTASLENDPDRITRLEMFNLLLIGHEQILAQEHYDQMADIQVKLAGLVDIQDAVGLYKLANAPWSDLRVRMALSLPDGFNPKSVTIDNLLNHTNAKGNITDYYSSRLHDPQASKLFVFPPYVTSQDVSGGALATGTGKDLIQAMGCNGCHAIRGFEAAGTMAGPSLLDVGKRLDTTEIKKSMMNPNARLAVNVNTGNPYPSGVMPTDYSTQLDDGEIAKIIAYLTGAE